MISFSYLKNKHNMINNHVVDVVLVGSGIMSATLGVYLKFLEPKWTVYMYERLNNVSQESSNGWNNAGTGHAAFCELNYTTLINDNFVDISKAISINESFEVSRQFWSFLVKENVLKKTSTFINSVPHISFVWGKDNIYFLRKRFEALCESSLFRGMVYSESPQQIFRWAPLIMSGRSIQQKVAATYMKMGTDINFGEITKQFLFFLQKNENFRLYLNHNVVDIKRDADNMWNIYITNNGDYYHKYNYIVVKSRYVFIGAGGASLILLQKSGIPEGKKYAGFPVGGKFLMTTNPKIVNKHLVKVYGKSLIGAPPMSVPHIDYRVIDGKKVLLFGPFATFSTRFLKYGSKWDLFSSLNKENIFSMLNTGVNNLGLIRYLISQLFMSYKDCFKSMLDYYPQANIKDWSLIYAGQRVQIIKKKSRFGGVLKFGTEIVSSSDGTLSALLGASPGASTSAAIILGLLNVMFKKKISSNFWNKKLLNMIPTYGKDINGNLELTRFIRKYTSDILKLNFCKV